MRRTPLEVLATTPDYVERYEYNAMRLNKLIGFDAPVPIWPAEFRAAAKLELEEKAKAQSPVLSSPPSVSLETQARGSNLTEQHLVLDPRFREDDKRKGVTNDQPP